MHKILSFKDGQLLFDAKTFSRMLAGYLVMTLKWSIISFIIDLYVGENKFHLKVIGFVSLFCISFVIGLKLRSISKIVFLLILFVSTVVSFALKRIRKIDFIPACVLGTSFLLLFAYVLQEKYSNEPYLEYGFHPVITMFNLWQGLAVLSLSFGMCLKRSPLVDKHDKDKR